MSLIQIQDPRTAGLVREWFNARGEIKPELDSVLSLTADLFDGRPIQGRGVVEWGFVTVQSAAPGEDVVAEWINDGLPGPIARDCWLERAVISADLNALVRIGFGSIASGGAPAGTNNEVLRDQRSLAPPLSTPLLSAQGRIGAGAATATASAAILFQQDVTQEIPLGILLPQGRVFQVFMPAVAAAGDQLRVTLYSRHVEPGTTPLSP